MARIRSINPGAPTDEDVATMSMAARLVWAYLPCHADRMGRLVDKPFGLKLDILPTDAVDMNAILDELAQRRHIIRYQVDGRRYIQIRSFDRYQRPHPHETPSQIPAHATYTGAQNRDIGEPTSTNVTATTANVCSPRSIPSPSPDPSPDPSPERSPPARDPSGTEPVAPEQQPTSKRTLTVETLVATWGRSREEEFGGLAWASGHGVKSEKLRDVVDALRPHPEAVSQLDSDMRRFWRSVRHGEHDKAAEIARSNSFAFGCWWSEFGAGLGSIPEISAPARTVSARAGPRQSAHEVTRAAALRFLEREASKDTAT